MTAWQMKIYGKRLLRHGTYIAVVSYLAISVYRMDRLGAFKNDFKRFKPATAAVFGTLPLVGSPIKKWARSGRKYRKGSVSKRKRKGRRRYRRSRRRSRGRR